jgi:hypothetical protein
MKWFSLRSSVLVAAAALSVAGCGRQTRTQSEDVAGATVRADAPRGSSAQSTEQKKAELLNRIRAADPQQATIERALMNENNELGLVLSRQTNLDDVPKLMKAMLAEMDRAFPGQSHTVIAYAPTNPPRTIGTARLDARTRDMTYTPASP